jgi:rhamnulokinase
MKYFLAIDLGASSGRHILGHVESGEIVLQEIYRFDNASNEADGRFFWDVDKIFKHIVAGLKECKRLNKVPKSVSLDTWGVDYALLDKNDNLIDKVFSYRDNRTKNAISYVHNIVSESELYSKTGIAFQSYNTVYQLADDLICGKLQKAHTLLMTPSYFNFLLTGVKANEYTIATTTGLVNAKTKQWDDEIIEKLSFPKRLFKKLANPRAVVGEFCEKIQREVGFNATVVLCASHDTASAVAAMPLTDNSVFISSGTWSLLGALLNSPKTDQKSRVLGYTNEGGYNNKIRFLKNIAGLWLIQSVKRELGDNLSYDEIVKLAKGAQSFKPIINVNDARFFNPKSMTQAINSYLTETNQALPTCNGELFFCIYNSLANCYAKAVEELETLTGKVYDTINISGGGGKNAFLCDLTAKAANKKVVAGPFEATALGNLLAQINA